MASVAKFSSILLVMAMTFERFEVGLTSFEVYRVITIVGND
jgi:hypothetical protein